MRHETWWETNIVRRGYWTVNKFKTRLNRYDSSRKGLLPLLRGMKTVLDVGCGPGLDYELYLENKVDIDYTGIDACEGFIEYNQKVHPEAKFMFGKSYDLPFEDKSFDLVTSRHVLEHLKEVEPTIRELCRVGKNVAITWFNRPGQENIILTEKGFYKNTYSDKKLRELIGSLGFLITAQDFKAGDKGIEQIWYMTTAFK
jgi:ubiquinone/menaquinone biosynthesis C-methylase UbiE